MQWTATHMLKAPGAAPRRVMLNSGEFHTKQEWDDQTTATWAESQYADKAVRVSNAPGPEVEVIYASVKRLGLPSAGSSITPLHKEVSRISVSTRVRVGGKMKRIVTTLGPGDVLSMRLEGQRATNAVPMDLLAIWSYGQSLQAKRLVAERKAARKKARNP